jgi:glutamate synthase (NADPH/NADH) small chain
MHQVLERKQLSPNVTSLVIEAPLVAAARQPGQFVIVRLGDGAERIPLTIADADPEAGTVTLVIQAVGASTMDLCELQVGDVVADVAGPLGRPTDLLEAGNAVCVGGGVGTAVIHPIAQGLAARGVRVTSVIGGRSREWVILEQELTALGEVVVCTDDGSYGRPGFVTEALDDLLAAGDVDRVYAVGPVPMMHAVAALTSRHEVPTIVSLNSIMVDGTGMCGGCRVTVGGQTRYACVDGPEFDARDVDFNQLIDRLTTYRTSELEAVERRSACRLDTLAEQATTRADEASLELTPTAPGGTPETPSVGMRAELTNRERMAIGRHPVPEREPIIRARDFDEVSLGYTEVLAAAEAERCLQCRNPQCIEGCPVRVNIPRFIDLVARRDLAGAAASLLDDNALPCVTGRVCPQETQCEGTCLRGRKGEPVAIGALERFVADWAQRQPGAPPRISNAGDAQRVAIVGSGPAGLSAAGELVKAGHQVTIFEAFHAPGGVLIYGIPEFRLPKDIVQREVDRLRRAGVQIEVDTVIGKTWTLIQLRSMYDAVFLAVGAGLPVFLDIPGENLKGVYSANEYLTRVNLMGAFRHDSETPVLRGQRVAVVGGGNVAMDAVRTALRLGADQAMLVYRRSRDELPARQEEVHHAEQEGVRFELLASPIEILGDAEGWVRGLRCQRMELTDSDGSGRRAVKAITGSELEIGCDIVVMAIGTRANPLLTASVPELRLNEWGYVVTDPDGMTSIPGVFAGGDIVRGAATVILAMGDGKRAAGAISRYLEHVGRLTTSGSSRATAAVPQLPAPASG